MAPEDRAKHTEQQCIERVRGHRLEVIPSELRVIAVQEMQRQNELLVALPHAQGLLGPVAVLSGSMQERRTQGIEPASQGRPTSHRFPVAAVGCCSRRSAAPEKPPRDRKLPQIGTIDVTAIGTPRPESGPRYPRRTRLRIGLQHRRSPYDDSDMRHPRRNPRVAQPVSPRAPGRSKWEPASGRGSAAETGRRQNTHPVRCFP